VDFGERDRDDVGIGEFYGDGAWLRVFGEYDSIDSVGVKLCPDTVTCMVCGGGECFGFAF